MHKLAYVTVDGIGIVERNWARNGTQKR